MRRPNPETPTLVFLGALSACLCLPATAVAADDATSAKPQTTAAAAPAQAAEAAAAWFARVDGTVIPADEYKNTVRSAYRTKFYHGKPPEGEVAILLRNTGQELIDRVLLTDEAQRRKIEPDEKEVQTQIDGYERRYSSSPTWPQMRETALPPLRKHLEGKSILAVLEKKIREVAEPTEAELQAYYDANRNLFTEPEKHKVSLILMRVDPSSSRDQWLAALAEGEKVAAELRAGADFATMARTRSNDKSADDGGDLGYLHTGMLPEAFQAKVDGMKVGDISDATRVLEGIAIYRVDDRIQSNLRSFETVKARAADLLKRDKANAQWKDFIAELRARAKVEIAPEFEKDMTPPTELSEAKPAEPPAAVVK